MVKLTINKKKRAYNGPPFKRLIDVLREDYGLTGAKEGCGEGECGACTVLIDGAPVNACLIPIGQLEGRTVETVESMGKPTSLSPLQESFLAHGGAQCGFCTPGMLVNASAFLKDGAKPKPEAIRRRLAGNLCRCTGYQHIVESVAKAAKKRPAPRAKASTTKRKKK